MKDVIYSILAIFATSIAYGQEFPGTFEPDPKLQQVAEAYSLDMVEFTKTRLGRMPLDWSERNLITLEILAELLHQDYLAHRLSSEQLEIKYKMVGSHLGEVFRKNHGATWGWIIVDGKRIPGMQSKSGGLFWPWGKAEKRIINGSSDDLRTYYRYLTQQNKQ